MTNDVVPCSLNNCPNHAMHAQSGEAGPWRITLHYCMEHWRELQQGVPLGGVGIDATRVTVQPLETATMPNPEVASPSIGH